MKVSVVRKDEFRINEIPQGAGFGKTIPIMFPMWVT